MTKALCLLLGVLLMSSLWANIALASTFPPQIHKRWAVIICGWLGFMYDPDTIYDLLTTQFHFDEVMYLSTSFATNISNPRVSDMANKENVRWALSSWLSRSDGDDLVFVYVSSHGGGCNSTGQLCGGRVDTDGDEPLKDYWDGTKWVGVDESIFLQKYPSDPPDFEYYWDDEMKEDLSTISFGRLVVMFQSCKTENSTSELSCFSGGFISDLQGVNRIILTCTTEKDPGFGKPIDLVYVDAYGVPWWQATGGFSNPFFKSLVWLSQEFQNADINNDFIVTIKEAFEYAYSHDIYRQVGWETPLLEDTVDPSLYEGALAWLTSFDKSEDQPTRIPPDINDDGYVNIKDAVIFGYAFGAQIDPHGEYWRDGEGPFDSNNDINDDGYINIKDAVILGVNFGIGLAEDTGSSSVSPSTKLGSDYLTVLKVQPAENIFYTNQTGVGGTFTVSIIAENVSDLCGWEFILEWNPGVINCTGETINYAFWPYYLGPWLSNPMNNAEGRYHQSLSANYPSEPFDGTAWLVNLTFQIVQAPPEGETVSTDLTISPTLGQSYCLIDTNTSEIAHTFSHGTYEYISPPPKRYMRGDTQTVNSLTAYNLGKNQSSTEKLESVEAHGSNMAYWGVRVWKRNTEGVETEITSGTPVAQVSRSRNGYGIQTAAWDCPNTTLALTDSIVIRVYCKNGRSWILIATFTTEQLNATALKPATWTLNYWTQRNYAWTEEGWMTIADYGWGTTAYNSHIQNFKIQQ